MSTRPFIPDEYSWKYQFSKTEEPVVSPINIQPNIHKPFSPKQNQEDGTDSNKVRFVSKDINSNNIFAVAETCTEAVDSIGYPNRNCRGMSPRMVDSYDHLTNTDHPEEQQSRTYSAMCDMLETCLLNLSKKIRNSKYSLAVPIILLAMPLSACYMGIKYIDKCPVKPVVPFLVLIIGIMGLSVLVCHIVIISTRLFFPNRRRIELKVIKTIDMFFVTLVFLLLEISGFYAISPDFNQESSKYCAKEFYSYTYNMNFAALTVSVLALLLHVSSIRADLSSTSFYETI